jgi:signal peptidase II
MKLYESIEILPIFNFTYMHNYGAAFSFLSDAGGWQRWFFSSIAVVISLLLTYWLKKLPAKNWVLCGAYAMVIGGAIGNLVDRLVHGYVVDFLHFYYQDWHYPAFNVADIAIVCGAGLLLLDAFTGEGADGSQEKKA